MSALTTTIRHCIRNPSQCKKARKINRRHTDQKERKLPLFTDMISTMKITRNLQKNLLGLLRQARPWNKINVKNKIMFLYTGNQQLEIKIRKQNH